MENSLSLVPEAAPMTDNGNTSPFFSANSHTADDGEYKLPKPAQKNLKNTLHILYRESWPSPPVSLK